MGIISHKQASEPSEEHSYHELIRLEKQKYDDCMHLMGDEL